MYNENFRILSKAVGQEDQTVHQLAALTGLTLQEVVNIKDHELEETEDALGVSDYTMGYTMGFTNAPEYRGNRDYWKGVFDKQYKVESTFIA